MKEWVNRAVRPCVRRAAGAGRVRRGRGFITDERAASKSWVFEEAAHAAAVALFEQTSAIFGGQKNRSPLLLSSAEPSQMQTRLRCGRCVRGVSFVRRSRPPKLHFSSEP